MRFLRSIADAVLDRSPEELIGAMLVASAIAIIVAGVFALARRKTPCPPTFVGLLALAAGVSCMVLAAGYLEYAATVENPRSGATLTANPRWPFPGAGQNPARGPWGFYGPTWSSGFHVVVAADENRDGRLTVEEATRLVKKADTDDDGSVDFRDIDRVLPSRFRPVSRLPLPSTPEGTERGGGDEASREWTDGDDGNSRDEATSPKLEKPVAPGPEHPRGR